MKTQLILMAVTAMLATACAGVTPTSPTPGPTMFGSDARVVTQDVPLNPPTPPSGPALGTGTNPGAGAPNSCPSDRPIFASNQNNGKVDLSTTKIGGAVVAYNWEIMKPGYGIVWKTTSYANDGREGRYAQPSGVATGTYLGRVQAVFLGCGPGTWSDYHRFSINGPSDTNETMTPGDPVLKD